MNYKKLLDFQKKVGAISKDSTNPFFKSNYFDINKLIEEVKPILNELGLILLQPLTNINGEQAIKTMIIDSEDNQILLEDMTPLPINTDPQKMGAIITYFRRYAVTSMLFLQAEDNDANDTFIKPVVQPISEKKIDYEAELSKPTTNQTTCQKCGGEMIINPKTGRRFCKNKCWLNPKPVQQDMPIEQIPF